MTKKPKDGKKPIINTKLKVGDPFIVIAGKDKGTKGKIKSINHRKNTLIAENINLVKKHKKPQKQDEKGEIISIPAPLHLSNVLYFSSKLNKGIRLAYKINSDGTKVRCNLKHNITID